MKSIPKILTALFLIVFIVELFGFLFILLAPALTQAQDIKFQPQIDVGTFKKDSGGTLISPTSIGEYIREIYKYAIGAVGILAAVVLMIGGIIWLTSGGNQTRVGEAKSWIAASLTGLIIALCSYLILATINPELVKIKSINPKVVTEIGCCQFENKFESINKDQCTQKGGSFNSGSCATNEKEITCKDKDKIKNGCCLITYIGVNNPQCLNANNYECCYMGLDASVSNDYFANGVCDQQDSKKCNLQ